MSQPMEPQASEISRPNILTFIQSRATMYLFTSDICTENRPLLILVSAITWGHGVHTDVISALQARYSQQ